MSEFIYILGAFITGVAAGALTLQTFRKVFSKKDGSHSREESLKARLKELEREKEELELLISSMSEGVVVIDQYGRVVKINRSGRQLLGLGSKEVRGLSFEKVVQSETLKDLIREVLESGETREKDFKLEGASGEMFVHTLLSPFFNSTGEKAGVLVLLNDVTRLKRLEQVRKDFVANVSHELKTPITSIKGYVETLLEEPLNDEEKVKKFLLVIERHANRLHAIIQDLLMLSRLEEEQKTDISVSRVNVKDLISGAVQQLVYKAEEKGIKIEVSCEDDYEIMGNAELLEHALVNLIDNAVKYSDPDQVVRVKAKAEEGWLHISVIDYGCGIPEEHLPRIFERFYRVDKARSRKLGGTGLGLAIVKHIAQLHRGKVTVKSKLNEGSTFTLSLPLG